MVTDWVLIRRLAFELEERLRGWRLDDAGALSDGRLALVLRTRGRRNVLALDLFGTPPLVTMDGAGQEVAHDAGFARTLATALRGMTLARVSARREDRILRFEFQTRSRFGVGAALDLYVELVPRFGNAILVKGETIVAAAKEFSPAENPTRTVMAGLPYVLPPLPSRKSAPAWAADCDDAMRVPLFVYRSEGRVLQAHVIALPAVSQAALTREPSLIDIFGELQAQRAAESASIGAQRRRRELLKRLDRRERKLLHELERLDQKHAGAAAREELRREGEMIFASLHERPERERAEAKERAASLFSEYKKLGAALPHLLARERSLRASLETIRELRWEAERTGDEEFSDVEQAVAQLEPRNPLRARPPARARRAPFELRTIAGSRIFVGRSPAENAELTFRIARPNDLWFHARNIPGAHVVLARDDRTAPPVPDLEAAAALAAFHSKGCSSGSVPVDYTLRKHVRKRPNAPPGLVWYTHAKTIQAEPDARPGVIA
ncbi:MAG: DUF814 domain-containing protein, partial [Candidatus Eremiobacteraeota bacterium]|nr:DUF814 domain-containing protein [Candidatus Eremiobacteraeota bacterium]